MLYARKDFIAHCSQISHGGSGLNHPPFNKSLSQPNGLAWLASRWGGGKEVGGGAGALEIRNEGSGGVFGVSQSSRSKIGRNVRLQGWGAHGDHTVEGLIVCDESRCGH